MCYDLYMVRVFALALLLASCAVLVPGSLSHAQTMPTAGTTIQGGHSGNWFNLGQSGHGLFVEVIDDPLVPAGRRVVLGWYAFFNGEQVWILAVGDVIQTGDGQVAVMEAWIYDGTNFPPSYNPELTTEIPWGEIRIYFLGCDDGVVEWDSVIEGYGSGELLVQRLTTISGTECDPDAGGIELDDHGDTRDTATSFPTQSVYNNFIEGRHENRDDVDVFVFAILNAQQVAIWTDGSSDTTGTLYAIVNNRETELEFDDNDGVNDNFLIERELTVGTYSIHVGSSLSGIYGAYRIHLQTDDD